MNKLKAFMLATLLVAAPAYSQDIDKPKLCADLSMRLVAFTMVAAFVDSKEQYDSFMYRKLVETSPNKETQDLLVKMIKLAWTNRNKDAHALGLQFYDMCIESGVGI